MKKLILLSFVVGAVAMAATGHSKVTTTAFASIATEPTSATAGVPTEDSSQELRYLIVTAKQANDGGAEDGELNALALRAWKYSVQGTLADAGTLYRWSRFPELDIAYASDAGSGATAYAVHNNGLTFTKAIPPMGNLDRVAVTAHGAGCVDAGVCNIDLIVEGRYLDPMAPR